MQRQTSNSSSINRQKVLFISSCGGHWVQMNRLRAAFSDQDIYYASTDRHYAQLTPTDRFSYVTDASRTSGVVKILWQALSVLAILIKLHPQIVLTTGAAPGFFALFFAKKMGMRTIWVDSIANVDEVSMSGRKAAKYADLFITQWEHLAREKGPKFYGSVI